MIATMNQTLAIDLATAADVPDLIALYRQLDQGGTPAPPITLERALKTWRAIAANPNHKILVARLGGRVVGCSDIVIVQNLRHGRPYAILENVVVDEKHRSLGIGRALTERAVAIAREAGCYRVSLTSDRRREDAHRFYEREGFAFTHRGYRKLLD